MMENVSRGTTKNLIDKCPLCDGAESDLVFTCEDYTVSHEKFPIHECRQCGFVYTKEIPEEKSIGEYYKSDTYISHSDQKKGIINQVYAKVRNYTLKQKVNWARQFAQGNDIVDLGAGTGYFVNALQKSKFSVVGFEPDQDARKVALDNFGLHLKPLDLFYEQEKIENLTMWHVLEHVYHLQNFLNFIAEKMTKGGAWIFAVPNCESWDAQKYKSDWAAWDVPRHLYHFKKDQIKMIADQYGFSVEKIIPMHFDAYYVALLSEKYKKGNPLRAMMNAYKSEAFAQHNNNSSLIYVLRKK